MLLFLLGIFHANRTTKCLRNQGRTKGEGRPIMLIFLLINVGILTFMSRKNFMLSSALLSMKKSFITSGHDVLLRSCSCTFIEIAYLLNLM